MLAQSVTRVTPEISSPGDVVLISGTTWAASRWCGSARTWEDSAASRCTRSFPPGNRDAGHRGGAGDRQLPAARNPERKQPVRDGRLRVGPAFSSWLTFFYCEQTAGAVDTPGLGTTAGGLNGRPVVGFKIAGGAPVQGNPLFTLSLENATPSATTILAVGAPATLGATYLDGFIGIDLTLPFQLLPTPVFTVDASGDVVFSLPIPPVALNITAAVVWVIFQPGSGSVGISDGLKVTL